MGLFEHKTRLHTEDIKHALLGIKSLDSAQKKELLELFLTERDFGGITKKEWLEISKQARQCGKISEVDYKNLKQAV